MKWQDEEGLEDQDHASKGVVVEEGEGKVVKGEEGEEEIDEVLAWWHPCIHTDLARRYNGFEDKNGL